MMSSRRRNDSPGIALVTVLLIIGSIIAVTLELNASSRAEISETANMRDRLKAATVARSGFEFARTVVSEQDANFDSLLSKWSRSDVLSAFSSSLYAEGYFKLQVEDESGKIPVNSLVLDDGYNAEVRDVMVRLLGLPEFGLGPDRAAGIVNAVKDWLDADSIVTEPSEKDQREPYPSKDGAVDSLEELLLVRGISPELFYGKGKAPGLVDLLTIYGDGRININTAPLPVLKALAPGITADLAEQMDKYRQSEGSNLSDSSWYRKIPGLSGINISSGLITVRSSHFKIRSTGFMNGMSETVTGIVRRGEAPGGLQVLSWKVEQ
ncbi:MAG: type II secretion system protein GspK [Syntrophales bacterium]|nr:type II secretion system protein GspK [Syntrophales bacterium]MDD5233139.1 type II secretion system protein GspK [Syntrophales bacterium]